VPRRYLPGQNARARAKPRGTGADQVKTSRERAEEKREEKLEQIRDAVASGKLVVREMTEEERLKYPARPVPEPKRRYSR
jgi:hypothetical protein